MIYFLGASHMAITLSAWIDKNDSAQERFGKEEPAFLDFRLKAGETIKNIKAASIYIAHFAPWWGKILALKNESGELQVAPGFIKLIQSIGTEPAGEKDALFVFMTGEEHYHLGKMEHEPPVDFYLPSHPELNIAPERQVIPLSVIETQLRAYLENAFKAFEAIRRLQPYLEIINVICPPPILSGEATKSATIQAQDIVRLKYYLLYSKIMRETLTSLNIASILPPESAIDENSFLLSEYVKDNVHGNHLYGEKVIDQIKQFIESRT